MTWNDVALNFDFIAGTHYVLDFGFTADYGANDLETFYWWYPSGATTSFDVGGLLTVTKGDTTTNGSPDSNPLIPDFRINTSETPEPATMALFGAGLLGLGVARFRRARS